MWIVCIVLTGRKSIINQKLWNHVTEANNLYAVVIEIRAASACRLNIGQNHL